MDTPDWKTELGRTPSLAAVSFAARCSRRVQPLFLVSWPDAPQRLYQLLDGAIETVEESICGMDRTTSTFAFNGMSAVKAASKAQAPQASCVASTIACATYALAAVGYGDFSNVHAAQAADFATKAFQFRPSDEQKEGLRMIVDAMLKDIEDIRVGIAEGKIGDGLPFPTDFFGALWPDGEPAYAVQLAKPTT